MTVQSDARWRRMLEGTLGIPATEGNQVEATFAALVRAVDAG